MTDIVHPYLMTFRRVTRSADHTTHFFGLCYYPYRSHKVSRKVYVLPREFPAKAVRCTDIALCCHGYNVTNALVLNIVLLVIGSTLLHFRERCVLNACTVTLYTCLREVCTRVHKCYLHLKT